MCVSEVQPYLQLPFSGRPKTGFKSLRTYSYIANCLCRFAYENAWRCTEDFIACMKRLKDSEVFVRTCQRTKSHKSLRIRQSWAYNSRDLLMIKIEDVHPRCEVHSHLLLVWD